MTAVTLANVDAEEAVLGSILINPDIYPELSQFLRADDFYVYRNRWVWTAFVHLVDRKTAIDYLTTVSELTEMKMLAEIGGEAYLTSLIGKSPNSMNAVAYGKTVEGFSQRRRLLAAANSIATLVYDTVTPIDEVISGSISKLQLAVPVSTSEHKQTSILLTEHGVEIARRSAETDAHIGILTRLTDVDRLLGFGLQKKFWMLAGRPGNGKSSLAFQIALEAIKQGKTVAIFSLEMDAQQVINVILSMMTGIDNQRLALGRLTPEEWDKYNTAQETMGYMKDRLYIYPNSTLTVPQMRNICLNLKMVGDLDLVIVDYLMRVAGYAKLDANDKANALTTDMYSLNKELGSAWILIHHMNRGIEHRADDIPILSDLNEGGERDPDIVTFLHPSSRDIMQAGKMRPMRLTFAKHRGGPLGVVDLLFDGPTTTFKSAAPRYISLAQPRKDLE